MSVPSQHSLEYLDDLPESLYIPVVTHHHGSLEQRCLGVLLWRKYLLDGTLPDLNLLDWPLLPERTILVKKLESSNLLHHCINQTSTTHQVILDILGWLDNEEHDFVFNEDNHESVTNDDTDEKSSPDDQITDPIVNDSPELTTEYEQTALSDDQLAKDHLLEKIDWQQHAQRLDELDDLMKDYAVLRKLGSNLSKGLLSRTEWKDILRVHKDIKHSWYLKNIIALIGRSGHINASSKDNIEHKCHSRLNKNKKQRLHFSHHAPLEASGITRSDDIGRMLAVELSALGHRTLKRLWHVKRAERMLLSYQYEGVLSEHLPCYESEFVTPDKSGKQQLESAGPMVIALDTSASMKGNPEAMAKAIALETMRVAAQENRACYILAFSGPDQIHEYELSDTEQGWRALLDVVSLSFHGGTDISSVVKQACARVKHKNWNSADLLLVSDSRFNVTDELLENVEAIKENYSMRLHGINVSSWNSMAMKQLCQPVYRITKI